MARRDGMGDNADVFLACENKAIDDSMQSTLAEAASFGHGEIVKLLLDSGATPLALAFAYRR